MSLLTRFLATTCTSCVPEAQCVIRSLRSAECVCPQGFGGDGRRNGTGCVDVNECTMFAPVCKDPREVCINLPGSYRCECAKGYAREPIAERCVDIDECTTNKTIQTRECGPRGMVCHNLPGSYECRCPDPDHVFDDILNRCRPRSMCADNNPCDTNTSVCSMDRDARAHCICLPGFRKSALDENVCLDVDECATNTHACPGLISSCKNTAGSYECECSGLYGFKNAQAVKNRQCVNLNECLEQPEVCGELPCCKDLLPSMSRKLVHHNQLEAATRPASPQCLSDSLIFESPPRRFNFSSSGLIGATLSNRLWREETSANCRASRT